jgi:cyclopropane-fatty-acyl-phospholipid synthase
MNKYEGTMVHEADTSLGQNMLGIPNYYLEQSSGNVTALDKWLTRKIQELINDAPISFVLWNREEIRPANTRPVAKLHINSRSAIIQLLINPEYHFGDLYCIKAIDVEGDLPMLLHHCYRALRYGNKPWVTGLFAGMRRFRRATNSIAKSRQNIYHHYDIGNDFYKLWLDRAAMQYTCAYFPDPEMSLEDAQIAKMHHICRKLQLRPGQTVVEAGCGWGGLARFMAREYGVRVKAYNISHEQIEYARKQAGQEGLNSEVEYVEDDYRNITGEYDVFVSVGMLEHVGLENYGALSEVIDRCLKDGGTGLIHTIGRNEPGLMNPWIEARIFPGAIPPSLSQMMTLFEPRSFSVLDVENLRLHYARTLKHWLARFEQHRDQVQQTYDEIFVRAWSLYLAGSVAAFTSGTMQLFQVLFTRPLNNDLAWSRSHLYK